MASSQQIMVEPSRTPQQDSSTSLGRRRSTKENIEAAAEAILIQIPGVSRADVQQYLYMARMVTAEDEEYEYIKTYIRNSQEHGFGIKVLDIIRIVRKNDYEFEHDPSKRSKFRMMLWHGTKLEVVESILKKGIQNPVPKGQMFGTGMYFADRASKSAQYCTNSPKPSPPLLNSVGYLFLCDVLLGEVYNAKAAHNDLTSAPTYTDKRGKTVRCDSLKCTGENVPNRDEQEVLGGSIWPIGKTVKNTRFPTYTVRYNEFTVYNTKSVKAKYLVKVQFTSNRVS